MEEAYDAILIVGFGGPEKKDDVIPFLENVLRGRNVPRGRMLEVATHYENFGGASPYNAQVRELMAAIRAELDRCGIDLPVYWGNRNWHPMLTDTLQTMTADGVRRAMAVVLAAYSSYSSCRQYLEDIQRARQAAGSSAPQVDKIRVFYNHPQFIDAGIDRVRQALERIPADRRNGARVAFTAHSIPLSMAAGCDYQKQLDETCRLVAAGLGIDPERWQLVYQSRSGRPSDPWLEPDVCDHLARLREEGIADVVVAPIGFLSDHVEILYDLDEEARAVCDRVGLNMVRAATVGTHPQFVAMLRELVQERLTPASPRRAIGRFGPNHDACPEDCCPAPVRPRRTDTR